MKLLMFTLCLLGTENGQKKMKYSEGSNSLGENALLTAKVCKRPFDGLRGRKTTPVMLCGAQETTTEPPTTLETTPTPNTEITSDGTTEPTTPSTDSSTTPSTTPTVESTTTNTTDTTDITLDPTDSTNTTVNATITPFPDVTNTTEFVTTDNGTFREPSSGLSDGEIAGIAIGSIAGVAAVGGGVFGVLKLKSII